MKRKLIFGFCVLGILLFLGSSSPSVSAEPKYQFSKDWVNRGGRVRDWMSALRPYQGKAGVHALEIGSFEGLSAIWFLDNILTFFFIFFNFCLYFYFSCFQVIFHNFFFNFK